MKISKQTKIAKLANISDAFLSQVITRKKRPSWPTAKILFQITGIPIEVWMDGTEKQIREALNNGPKN